MSEPKAIRVLVAEDSMLMRLGTVTLIGTQDDMAVVGEAENGAQAVELFRKLRPDILVVDLKMPVLDGLQVTGTLCKDDPDARVIVLTHYEGEEDIFKAVKAGARAYLTKERRGQELLAAIRAVHRGDRYLPSEIIERLTQRMAGPALTGREQQVLGHVARGLTNRDIAAAVSLSEKTIAIYVSNILQKFGAKTRTEAVSIARQRGLIERP